MNKEELDQLYHNLRELCITEDVFQKEAVAGITNHLTQPQGDYQGLLRFLSYYGENYTLPSVIKLLTSSGHLLKFSRIVELGAGFAWLGRGISNAYNLLPVVFVDKRQWIFTSVVADIETKNGIKRVLDEMKEGDLLVMSELLHCLDNPKEALQPFTRWPMMVIEYMPSDPSYKESYNAQIKKFNCKPIVDIRDVFPGAKIIAEKADPYIMWLVLPL